MKKKKKKEERRKKKSKRKKKKIFEINRGNLTIFKIQNFSVDFRDFFFCVFGNFGAGAEKSHRLQNKRKFKKKNANGSLYKCSICHLD